jgi:hypothetical protein
MSDSLYLDTPFTHNEAREYLGNGQLPDKFYDRLHTLAEIELNQPCSNCDDRKCMGCIFREYNHDCADDCPFCC